MRESLEHGFVRACHSATECVEGEDAMVQGLASVPKHGPLKPRETVLCEFVLARKPLARIEQGGISFAVISMCIRKNQRYGSFVFNMSTAHTSHEFLLHGLS